MFRNNKNYSIPSHVWLKRKMHNSKLNRIWTFFWIWEEMRHSMIWVTFTSGVVRSTQRIIFVNYWKHLVIFTTRNCDLLFMCNCFWSELVALCICETNSQHIRSSIRSGVERRWGGAGGYGWGWCVGGWGGFIRFNYSEIYSEEVASSDEFTSPCVGQLYNRVDRLSYSNQSLRWMDSNAWTFNIQ